MFIPVHDDNPLRIIRAPFVTIGLIVLNALVFLWQASGAEMRVIASFAIIPFELFQVKFLGGPANGPLDALPIAERYTLLSYMFFHGDLLHLVSNMTFLWVFGDNVEDAMGHLKFLVFYVACGIIAGLTHTLMLPLSKVPLIGASGAVAGVIAAYLILHPRVRVWVLALRVIPLRITAGFALGAWILTQLIMLFVPQSGPVAWWAHIGGIIAGGILIVLMRRPGTPLFDRPSGTA